MNAKKTIELSTRLVNLAPFGLVKNEALLAELQQKNMEVFDFTLGDPIEPTPDFIRQALSENIPEVSQYPSTNGLFELRHAASQWLQTRFGVELDPQTQIISSNGSKEAVFHIHNVLIDQHSTRNHIVFPEPAYPVYKSGTILAGGQPYEIPLKPSHHYVFDVNDIPKEKIPQIAALWVCYPHNPTGGQISDTQARTIYQWALENGVVLLADECYVDMYFEERAKPLSFLQIAQKENYKNLLCFFSLSKRSGMTGYRTGFVAGDELLISMFAKYRLNVGLGTPNFIQHAAIKAWGDDVHVQARNKIFAEKRNMLERFLTSNNIEFLKSRTTFYIWATIPSPYECSRAYCAQLARSVGIFATPGEVFGPNCKKYFRLALVPSLSQLETCLGLWQKSIHAGDFL